MQSLGWPVYNPANGYVLQQLNAGGIGQTLQLGYDGACATLWPVLLDNDDFY
jgi:hypothetical protein